ncbi:MAG: hypothetical protein JO353_13090 [Phycisphaerae bacterium]|nr:hypothetical protein [Phycisphaerae bacterium]
MKTATQKLGQLPSDSTPAQRKVTLAEAKQSQAQAGDILQRALDRLGNIGSLQQTIARINDVLRQQKELSEQTRQAGKEMLGRTPDQLTDEQRKKLAGIAAQQDKLGDETAKAIGGMKKAADQLSKSDPAAAEAMSKAAQTGGSQQVSANQKKAAQQTQENQQSSAQSAQQQAELGLQMMASDLEQAQRRQLAQLSAQLEDLQQQIANLIRRQAGHNLDNITVQGPPATQPADLKSLAAREDQTPLADINHLAATLAPSQEQTSTNTRDISKTAESLPQGATAASQLLRAADHMDRAIVNLQSARFADAYNPPQIEALAALQSAKKTVDEQKQKVDEQLQQGQKEALRQKYLKIKEDQEKLNAEVTRIDTIRDASNPLKRPDAIRLGQLPGEQGALADHVSALDKDLSAIGSIVYTWANHDIASAMNGVKGDLPDQTKDASTLASQANIVDQLDAMIRNLAIKPKVSQFATDSGGGSGSGSGGGAPPLPPEVELRLLKELQKQINAQTKSLDATGKTDAPRAMAIGTRQGDIRNLLSQLLEKSSHGQLQLGPEPDNKNQLPEEASDQDVENNELDQTLLTDKPTAEAEEKQSNLVGERMARSRQRLALNDDPGHVTQIIQDKILRDLDSMIDQARQQEAEVRNPPKSNGKSQQQTTPEQGVAKTGQVKPGSSNTPHSSNPAQASNAVAPGNAQTELSKQIKESLAEWGAITPRLRAAQIEGSSESIIEQYRKLTEDYYRSLAAKASQH